MSLPIAGTARVDITPAWPVMQGGFGQRIAPCTGVHDPVFAKALYLANETDRLLIITADLICIPGPLGSAVIALLAAQAGLLQAQICVCASHTHSGPLPFDASGTAQGVAEYTPVLRDALAGVALAAIACARPCRVRTGIGEVDVFLNRRTRGAPNIVDKRVAVVAVDDAVNGALQAVLFGVGCHPVTMGWDNMAISADFPGVAQALIEAEFAGATALFFNTTEGNVIPRTSPNLDALDPRGYCGGGFAHSSSVGAAIAAEVVRVVRADTVTSELRIGARRMDLQIDQRNAQLDLATARTQLADGTRTLCEFLGDDFAARVPAAQLWSVASARVIALQMSETDMRRLMLACCHFLGLSARVRQTRAPRPTNVPVQLLRINDFLLLALPGEVLVETGQAWTELAASERIHSDGAASEHARHRRGTAGNAFIVGLANAHLRYLPSSAHFAEPDAARHYETVTAGLAPDSMDVIFGAAARMLDELRIAR